MKQGECQIWAGIGYCAPGLDSDRNMYPEPYSNAGVINYDLTMKLLSVLFFICTHGVMTENWNTPSNFRNQYFHLVTVKVAALLASRLTIALLKKKEPTHAHCVPMEFPLKLDSSVCSRSSKSRLILSLAACYLNTSSVGGQSVEGWGTGDVIAGVGGLEGARGLSSAQIKRTVGLASITLLIGPHLSARRGVGSGWRKCASWHRDHRHPRCSAVISHPQSLSLHPSHPRHLSALPFRLCCASASSPTSTPPPLLFLSLCSLLCLPGISSRLFPVRHPSQPSHSVVLSLHLQPHPPTAPALPRVFLLPLIALVRIARILVFVFSGLLAAALLLVACHSRLQIAGYI